MLVLPLAACNTDSLRPGPLATRSPEALAAVMAGDSKRRDESQLREIAAEIPDFGGMFLDADQNLVALATSASAEGPLRALLARKLTERSLGLPWRAKPRSVFIKRGRYPFRALSEWRDSATAVLLGHFDGVAFTDLDEGNNAVTVGVASANAAQIELVVRAAMTARGVPDSALRFVGVGPAALPVAPRVGMLAFGGQALNESTDTLSGGYRITGSNWCTIGLIMKRFGVVHVLTVSHCTGTMFQPGSQPFQNVSTVFGTEVWDTTGTGVGGNTRYSDVALVSVTGLPAEFATVTRPISRVSNQSGTRLVDTEHRYIYIVAAATGAIQGLEVDKIGGMTGWTYGTVINTCVDQTVNGFTVLCQIRTSVWGSGGDSGASLWAWDGQDGATLYGVTFSVLRYNQTTTIDGSPDIPVGNDSYYSSYGGFLNDIGSGGISVTTGTSIAASSLSGTMSSGNPALTWTTATVTNGDPAATRYYLYRETHQAGVGYTEPENAIAPYYSGTTYLDLNRTVKSYAGTSYPGPTKSFVGYRVTSYNRGASNSSSWVYFLTN